MYFNANIPLLVKWTRCTLLSIRETMAFEGLWTLNNYLLHRHPLLPTKPFLIIHTSPKTYIVFSYSRPGTPSLNILQQRQGCPGRVLLPRSTTYCATRIIHAYRLRYLPAGGRFVSLRRFRRKLGNGIDPFPLPLDVARACRHLLALIRRALLPPFDRPCLSAWQCKEIGFAALTFLATFDFNSRCPSDFGMAVFPFCCLLFRDIGLVGEARFHTDIRHLPSRSRSSFASSHGDGARLALEWSSPEMRTAYSSVCCRWTVRGAADSCCGGSLGPIGVGWAKG